MENHVIEEISAALNTARVNVNSVTQFSDQEKYKSINRSEAYTIQEKGIEFRKENGEIVSGMKMGLTSQAKREQMDLDSPLYGVLTDKMEIKNHASISLTGSIHPKIEPEIAFFITKELSGSPTREEVLDATAWVCPCMEILDSRYNHFKYFSMEDVIADNSSSFKYVLGSKIEDFKSIDLTNLEMKMLVNGEVKKTGNTNAISGDPVVSVIQLAQLLKERGQSIKPNQIILAGAATIAIPLEKNMKIELLVEGMDKVSINIDGE